MSKLLFNKDHRIDDFTFIIARRDFYKYGVIKGTNVAFKDSFNSPKEISFQLYKTSDLSKEVWDRVNDYNIIIVPELGDDGYFDIEVTLNEDEKGLYKSITGTSLAESELSHVKIYNYEVNTEAEMINDETWNKDNLTILYRDLSQYQVGTEEYKKKKHTSLIHRLLDKLPNYSIAHIDSTLLDVTEWYQFQWDDNDLYSILTGDVAEQYHVLFKFNSKNRSISIYDLYSVCNNDNCSYRTKMRTDRNIITRYRGDFKRVCPYCGSTNITPGYGKFTTIFVSKDNLSVSASVKSNKDSLVNTFKVKSGDELMDAAVANQNPNGSNYIYQFSDENKAEMPPELITALENYNTEYNKYYNGDAASGKGIYTFTNEEVSAYNNLISNITGHFPETTLANFINLKNTYTGYQSLASQYYSVMDLKAFYEYSMAPTPETNNDSLTDTKALLETEENLSPIAVIDPHTVTQSQVEAGILQSAKCIINTALYELTVNTNPQGWTPAPSKEETGIWTGTITIVSIEHKGTTEESNHTVTTNTLTIRINGDVATYVKQKVQKLINRKNVQIRPLTDLVNLDQLTDLGVETQIEDTEEKQAEFIEQLQYYSLSVLRDVVSPSFKDVISILQKNGNKINGLFYNMYYIRLGYIQDAITDRTDQIALIQYILDKIVGYRDRTKEALDFQNYLGAELYNVFCSYRREDTYQNSNYISDNLDNSQIMRRAGDLLDNAQKELYKSSHLQYEVSGNLNNLLALPSFASIIDDFEVGNWIHMTVDDKIYDLRLLSYQINFDELQSIDVEFSTVEKIWSGASDIQSVLKAAGSIAGSYSNTQLQVKRFQESDSQVKSWVSTGLDATKTRFVDDSTTQEIVYDSSGFYARGFDEISSSYLPAQLKINKNGLYLTEDNWEHVSTGIGAFTYYDPEKNNNTGGYVDSYGVIANTIVGKLILGENLKIINQNAKLKMDDNGLVISNGVNSFTVNPNNNSKLLALSNINQNQDLLWVDSSGNLNIKGALNATSLSTGSRTNSNTGTAGTFIDSTGAIYIGSTNACTISAAGKLTATGADISGEIKTTTGKIGNWDISSTGIYYGTDSMSSTIVGTFIGPAGIRQYASNNAYVNIQNGIITAKGASISGTLTASSLSTGSRTNSNTGVNGTFIDSTGAIYVGSNNSCTISAAGILSATGASISGSLTAVTLSTGLRTSSGTGTAGTFIDSDGNVYIGPSNQIILYANGSAQIGTNGISYNSTSGKISLGNNVSLNWASIPDHPTGILTTSNVGDTINGTYIDDLGVAAEHIRGTTISGKTISGGSIHIGTATNGVYPFQVDSNGVLTASGASISGEINATSGNIGSFEIYNGVLTFDKGDVDFGELILDPTEFRLSFNGNYHKHCIRLIPGGNKDIIKIYGTQNVFSIGYLSNARYEPETDLDPITDWGIYCSTQIKILSEDDRILLYTPSTKLLLGKTNAVLRPEISRTHDLGLETHRWKTIWSVDPLNSLSDRKDKDILGNINFASNFIMSLSPQLYMWKDRDHRRIHMGFIAQEVAQSCKNIGENLAVVSASYKNPTTEKQYLGENVDDSLLTWGMAYDELIAPMIAVMQQQQKEIEQLKKEVALLKQ